MSFHEQFAEDLALHALNALSGEERQNLERHLTTCAECRLELEQLRGDGALLAISVEEAKPPRSARHRLLDAVARETRSPATRGQSTPRRFWSGSLGWAAAAAVLVLALALWRENSFLKQNLTAKNVAINQQGTELRRAQEVVATLTSSDAIHVTLVAAKAPPQPQGKVFYLRKPGSLVFLASNMPILPPQKAYELWLIPTTGTPIPAGVFKPDAHGNATVLNPPLPALAEAKAFAVTIENEAGSSTPTMPIVMMGAGE